jgi:pimeloyl-ACP methyl ester carboxylesterase
MLDLLDLWLLRRGIPSDDRTLSFHRIDGNPNSKIIYFLPWHTSYAIARRVGLTPLDYLACYEMPPAAISSVPELSVAAMAGLVDDAAALLANRGINGPDALIVGFSLGSYPATVLANRIGARLCAVATADRADLMLWQSPATRLIKRRALQRGLRLAHYAHVMRGWHPAHNLANLSPGSIFVLGERDPFIPPRRSARLLQAIERFAPKARVFKLAAGHVKTMLSSATHQYAMAGLTKPRTWRLQIPVRLSWLQPEGPGSI